MSLMRRRLAHGGIMAQTEAVLAICGHSKHGKSTLVGRLLADTGVFTEAQIRELWNAAPLEIRGFADVAHDFNPYNFLLLREQTRTTIDPSRTAYSIRSVVRLGGRDITILDQPGH